MTSWLSGSWARSPIRSRASRGAAPSTVSSPITSVPSASRMPASAASRVDFPAPDAPVSRIRSPGSTTRSTPVSAQACRDAWRTPRPRATTRTGPVRVRIGAGPRVVVTGAPGQARVRPAAKELSAPVRARARTSRRPTTPASSTLEITVNTE